MRQGKVWRLTAPLAAVVLGLAGCSWVGIGHPTAAPASAAAKKSSESCAAKLPTVHRYLGLAVSNSGLTAAATTSFTKLVGHSPNLVAYYVDFGAPFDYAATCAIARRGALPLIQIDPFSAPKVKCTGAACTGNDTQVADIGDGFYDSYLLNFAAAVKKFGLTVAISFAHEMNGKWYPWGPNTSSPAAFVSAWRQMHSAFQAVGAKNVIWIWDPNIVYSYSPPLSEYYPGNNYVDWVGIDGYFRLSGETFQSVFGATLQQVAKLTSKPILIGETGVANSTGASAEVDSLFSAIRSNKNMLGLVYFNAIGTLNWQLQDDPSALAAFRAEVQSGW